MSERGRRFWVKLHHSKTGETVAAICDEELLGKKIKCDNGLEITVNVSFYGGVLVEDENVLQFVKDATIVNLFGEGVVEMFVRKGMVSGGAVLRVGGISHVQIFY